MADEVADGTQLAGVPGATAAALRCRGLVDDDPAVLLAAVHTYRQALPTIEFALSVARLAAEGLTNRQIGDLLFISRRTVGTHLAHIFQKLGINTRTQLAAHRQGQR